MLSKSAKLAAAAGLMSTQVEAFSFQDFVPQDIKNAVNDGYDMVNQMDFNATLGVDPSKAIGDFKKKSGDIIQFGKKKLGQVAKEA